MAMRDGLAVLADLVDRIEAGGVAVEDASLSRGDGDGYDVTLSVTIAEDAEPAGWSRGTAEQEDARSGPAHGPSVAGGPEFGAVSVDVGRSLGEDMRTPAPDGSADAQPSTAAVDEVGSLADERFECRVEGCEDTFDTEHGMKIHATKAHREADGSGPSPHRNPERLQEVYEACDTFEEMTEALGVDVTAQTVRRSMMSLGIHDPDDTSDDTDDGGGDPQTEEDGVESGEDGDVVTEAQVPDDDAADEPDASPEAEESADSEEPQSPSVGEPELDAALPDGVDPEGLVTAVREASTLFQVQRALGMEREEVQTLLAELGLLELVTGRVATEDDRRVSREEIRRRIVERAGDEDGGAGVAAEAD